MADAGPGEPQVVLAFEGQGARTVPGEGGAAVDLAGLRPSDAQRAIVAHQD